MANYFLENTETKKPGTWLYRTKVIAEVLKKLPQKYIHDFGCGMCPLKDLVKNKEFVFYDTDKFTDNETIIIDFNESFPIISGDRKERIAVCEGILEYLVDVNQFLRKLSNNFDYILFSYLKKNDDFHQPFKQVPLYYIDFILSNLKRMRFFPKEIKHNIDQWIYLAIRNRHGKS